MAREALIERNTKETQIRLQLNIDGTGSSDIDTGIGFFDHMLDGFTRHGLYDLTLRVHGDLNVDDHHTIEDTGIVLGNAIREAVGDKKGIKRYGSCILPMDEVLVLCAVDLSGRPYLGWDAAFSTEKIGDMATEMVKYSNNNILAQAGQAMLAQSNQANQGVLLCSILFRSNESSHQGSFRRKQPSCGRGHV